MAGKKPAKVNASNKKQEQVLPGKAIYYFGSKGTDKFTCPACKRSLLKGIIYEHTDGSSYCCRGCIAKAKTAEG
jgi:hypothetical protein